MNGSVEIVAGKNSGIRQIMNALFIALIAFLTYSSVYAFRKPFTVATFEGLKFVWVSYQTLLIISQVTGYMLSKFYGIRVISELKKLGRWRLALLLVVTAWLALFFFALVPPPFGMLMLFINGFALGFMWGIVFSYVEGRRATDFIGAVLAVSFIFAGGFTRSVAKWLMIEWNVSEFWMPFISGLFFILPFLLLIFLLEKIPAPDQQDERERTVRLAMSKEDRRKFMLIFGRGLIIITTAYLTLTIMRDIRDNYMANLWSELGYRNHYSVFINTETITSLLVLLVMGMMVLVRKNITALQVSHFIIGAGFLIAGITSWLFINNRLSGALWMQLTGFGLYLGYIPFNCIFFERLVAAFRIKGNVGFLIYFADAFGYLGSVLVMLMKEFFEMDLNWSQFYSAGVIIGSLIGLAGVILSFHYFNFKYRLKNI
jgi:MFS family permease